MSLKNPVHKDGIYFITMTVVGWIDVFTRINHKLTIVDALKYCQKHKGLDLYAWCLMSNHLHLIAGSNEQSNNTISDIIRDFKKFTSKKIVRDIEDEIESRRSWMLNHFRFAGSNDVKITGYKFWQDGYEAKEIESVTFMNQKLGYIHSNPVAEMIVYEPHEYIFSSALNYAGQEGLLEGLLI